MNLLENQNAVITGGSEGIGLGIAHSFAQNGANLVLIARDKKKLEIAKSELSRYGTDIFIISTDLSQTDQIEDLSIQILSYFSEVDILVNNAGIGKFVPFSEMDESVLDWHLDLNIKAPYLLTQKLLPSLTKAKGNIINISSYFAHKMLSGRTTTAYSITKGAINSFTKSLAFEVGHLGVRVNAIAPGSVRTPQLNRNLERLTEKEQLRFHEMVQTIYPLGNIGSIDDIGKATTFLASDLADWITGTILAVDGGLTTN